MTWTGPAWVLSHVPGPGPGSREPPLLLAPQEGRCPAPSLPRGLCPFLCHPRLLSVAAGLISPHHRRPPHSRVRRASSLRGEGSPQVGSLAPRLPCPPAAAIPAHLGVQVFSFETEVGIQNIESHQQPNQHRPFFLHQQRLRLVELAGREGSREASAPACLPARHPMPWAPA